MNRRDFIKASTALALTPLLSPFTFGDPAIGKEWEDWYAAEYVETLDDLAGTRKALLAAIDKAYKAGGFTRWADVRIEAHRDFAKPCWIIVATAAFR